MNVFELLFPDFSLILCGYLICRWTPLDRSVWQQVDRLVYFFLFPTLLFHAIIKRPLDLGQASGLLGAGLTFALCAIAMAYSLPHWPLLGKHIDRRDHASAAQIGFRFNSFIALAVVERIAGQAGLQLMAMLIGFCVPIFNIGAVWPMARHGNARLWHELARNPLIVATLSGLSLNLLGFSLPAFMEPSLQRIGNASLALGLLAAGAGMQLASLQRGKVLGASVLLCKHLALPVLAWLLSVAWALPTLEATVLLAFSAMPTAASCYVLAARMGYNGAYVAALVTLSTLSGLLSLPFALSWLR